jgi:hypothetical protein
MKHGIKAIVTTSGASINNDLIATVSHGPFQRMRGDCAFSRGFLVYVKMPQHLCTTCSELKFPGGNFSLILVSASL